MISVDLVNAPLIDVLNRIKQEAGYKVHLYGDLAEPITLSFTDLPLDKGLRRLTGNHSLSLIYHSSSKAFRQDETILIAEIWIFSGSFTDKDYQKKNTLRTLSSPDNTSKTAKPGEETLKSPESNEQKIIRLNRVLNDPFVKLANKQRAVDSLTRIGGSAAVMAMAAFLGNDDAELRQNIVGGIGTVQDERSIQILGQVIYSDPDSDVRMIAVRALAERQNETAAQFLLSAALEDQDEKVRELANQLLTQ